MTWEWVSAGFKGGEAAHPILASKQNIKVFWKKTKLFLIFSACFCTFWFCNSCWYGMVLWQKTHLANNLAALFFQLFLTKLSFLQSTRPHFSPIWHIILREYDEDARETFPWRRHRKDTSQNGSVNRRTMSAGPEKLVSGNFCDSHCSPGHEYKTKSSSNNIQHTTNKVIWYLLDLYTCNHSLCFTRIHAFLYPFSCFSCYTSYLPNSRCFANFYQMIWWAMESLSLKMWPFHTYFGHGLAVFERYTKVCEDSRSWSKGWASKWEGYGTYICEGGIDP